MKAILSLTKVKAQAQSGLKQTGLTSKSLKNSIYMNKKKKLELQPNKKKLNAPELKPRLKLSVKD